jgi:hypothetical protein
MTEHIGGRMESGHEKAARALALDEYIRRPARALVGQLAVDVGYRSLRCHGAM